MKISNIDFSPYNTWVLAWREDLKHWFVGRRTDFNDVQVWETRNHNRISIDKVSYFTELPYNPENVIFKTLKTIEEHEESYHLYLKLVEVLIGEDVEIAISALSKCKFNLFQCENNNERKEENENSEA